MVTQLLECAQSNTHKQVKPLKTETELYINIQSVPRSKHTPSRLYKTSQLMLYREIIAVCSEIHTKHINTLCGQNVELLNVKLVVHSDHWAVNWAELEI